MNQRVVNKLEELVLYAERRKNEITKEYGEDSLESMVASAYEEGVFTAFAILKQDGYEEV